MIAAALILGEYIYKISGSSIGRFLVFTAVLSGTAVFLNIFVRFILKKQNGTGNGKRKILFKGTGMILVDFRGSGSRAL